VNFTPQFARVAVSILFLFFSLSWTDLSQMGCRWLVMEGCAQSIEYHVLQESFGAKTKQTVDSEFCKTIYFKDRVRKVQLSDGTPTLPLA
jgi:hypothetical protein